MVASVPVKSASGEKRGRAGSVFSSGDVVVIRTPFGIIKIGEPGEREAHREEEEEETAGYSGWVIKHRRRKRHHRRGKKEKREKEEKREEKPEGGEKSAEEEEDGAEGEAKESKEHPAKPGLHGILEKYAREPTARRNPSLVPPGQLRLYDLEPYVDHGSLEEFLGKLYQEYLEKFKERARKRAEALGGEFVEVDRVLNSKELGELCRKIKTGVVMDPTGYFECVNGQPAGGAGLDSKEKFMYIPIGVLSKEYGVNPFDLPSVAKGLTLGELLARNEVASPIANAMAGDRRALQLVQGDPLGFIEKTCSKYTDNVDSCVRHVLEAMREVNPYLFTEEANKTLWKGKLPGDLVLKSAADLAKFLAKTNPEIVSSLAEGAKLNLGLTGLPGEGGVVYAPDVVIPKNADLSTSDLRKVCQAAGGGDVAVVTANAVLTCSGGEPKSIAWSPLAPEVEAPGGEVDLDEILSRIKEAQKLDPTVFEMIARTAERYGSTPRIVVKEGVEASKLSDHGASLCKEYGSGLTEIITKDAVITCLNGEWRSTSFREFSRAGEAGGQEAGGGQEQEEQGGGESGGTAGEGGGEEAGEQGEAQEAAGKAGKASSTKAGAAGEVAREAGEEEHAEGGGEEEEQSAEAAAARELGKAERLARYSWWLELMRRMRGLPPSLRRRLPSSKQARRALREAESTLHGAGGAEELGERLPVRLPAHPPGQPESAPGGEERHVLGREPRLPWPRGKTSERVEPRPGKKTAEKPVLQQSSRPPAESKPQPATQRIQRKEEVIEKLRERLPAPQPTPKPAAQGKTAPAKQVKPRPQPAPPKPPAARPRAPAASTPRRPAPVKPTARAPPRPAPAKPPAAAPRAAPRPPRSPPKPPVKPPKPPAAKPSGPAVPRTPAS